MLADAFSLAQQVLICRLELRSRSIAGRSQLSQGRRTFNMQVQRQVSWMGDGAVEVFVTSPCVRNHFPVSTTLTSTLPRFLVEECQDDFKQYLIVSTRSAFQNLATSAPALVRSSRLALA